MFFLSLLSGIFSSQTTPKKEDRLAKANSENKNGWINIHLAGSPADIGCQHGYLLSDDIDTPIQAIIY